MLYAFAEKFMENPDDLETLREVMRMTRLGQMLFDVGWDQGRDKGHREGLEEGRKEGREEGLKEGLKEDLKEGQVLINRLNMKLIMDNRIDDLKKSLSDHDFQQVLLSEYNIEPGQENHPRV